MEPDPFSRRIPIAALSLFFLISPTAGILGSIAALIGLLFSSAMVSGAEVAFFALTHNDYAKLREEGSSVSKLILDLKERPRTLLATILVGNNFINIAIVILSEYVLNLIFPSFVYEAWAQWIVTQFQLNSILPSALSVIFQFTVTVVGATFLLVLFGEVIPKVYARNNKLTMAKSMAGPLNIMVRLFRPLTHVLDTSTSSLERLLENKKASGSIMPSKEDMEQAIELTVSNNKDAHKEMDLLKSIVKFNEIMVKQIMKSRVDVSAIDVESTFDEVLAIVRESGYSRIPVYEEDFDHIVGILYVKDLLGLVEEPDTFNWQALVRKNTMFIPENKKISDLLKDFQSKRNHIAIVVDEFGGTAGLVTLEDILEEVIGDIQDEFDDDADLPYVKIDDFNFQFEGKTLLKDVYRALKFDNNIFDKVRGDADTIAGMLLEVNGSMPKVEKQIIIEDISFKILSSSKRRIEQVLITLPAGGN